MHVLVVTRWPRMVTNGDAAFRFADMHCERPHMSYAALFLTELKKKRETKSGQGAKIKNLK